MKTPTRYIYFLSLILFVACSGKETSNDKYPEIPYFPASSSDKYSFEKIAFIGATRVGNFVLRNTDFMPEDSLVVFDLIQGKLRTFSVEGRIQYIDVRLGYLITSMNDSVFFKYSGPEFKHEPVKFLHFRSCYDSAAENIADEAKARILSDSIDNVKLRSIASCFSVLYDRQHYLLHGDRQDIVIRYPGIRMDLPECLHAMDSEFQRQYLEPFDEVILDYSLSGSNHIAFGIEVTTLYYYEYKIGSEALNFKSTSNTLEFFTTRDSRIFVMNGERQIFEVKKR